MAVTSSYLRRPAQARPNYRVHVYDQHGRFIRSHLVFARLADTACNIAAANYTEDEVCDLSFSASEI
jgi:hypothetical protein